MGNTILDNDGKHIHRIVTSTFCKKHSASEGIACYHVFPGSSSGAIVLLGVCGSRVKRAGYTGTISPTSMRLKTPGGRTGPKPRR